MLRFFPLTTKLVFSVKQLTRTRRGPVSFMLTLRFGPVRASTVSLFLRRSPRDLAVHVNFLDDLLLNTWSSSKYTLHLQPFDDTLFLG